jgi:hypothetical protein
MDLKQISDIHSMNKERFSSTKEMYEFLMFQMQSHMIEIDDLKNNGDDHYIKEIADLAILGKLLAECEGVDDSVFCERYKKFREKIEENK